MIKNEREYKISKSWLNKFQEALAQAKLRKAKDENDVERLQIRIAGLESQVEELINDIAKYEALKSGKTQSFTVTDLRDLPLVIIQARIARNLTHKALAEKLGVSEKQVQRDEANEYATAGLNRLIKVADTLAINLELKAELR